MASLNIVEFGYLGSAGNGAPQIAAMPPIATQNVEIGSEADSTALSGQTKFVRLAAGAACCIRIGSGNPAATTSDLPMAAGAVEYFGVQPGHLISVIAAV